MSSAPPIKKTFFLIRHGESKWNLAQSKINIAGMMDRDHALTEEGIKQAAYLNQRWKDRLPEELKPQKKAADPLDEIISFLDPPPTEDEQPSRRNSAGSKWLECLAAPSASSTILICSPSSPLQALSVRLTRLTSSRRY